MEININNYVEDHKLETGTDEEVFKKHMQSFAKDGYPGHGGYLRAAGALDNDGLTEVLQQKHEYNKLEQQRVEQERNAFLEARTAQVTHHYPVAGACTTVVAYSYEAWRGGP